MVGVVKPKTDEECRAHCEAIYPVSHPSKRLLNKLWALAWEAGHSGGYGNVANYYCDFAEAAQAGINAALVCSGASVDG